tara:strand:- start:370 stop:549 length:180 start_codon:yes stop_codon:yes gene_type:complete
MKHRINHVNETMDEIHNLANEIYEHWVDEERKEARRAIKKLIQALTDLLNSLKDDTEGI